MNGSWLSFTCWLSFTWPITARAYLYYEDCHALSLLFTVVLLTALFRRFSYTNSINTYFLRKGIREKLGVGLLVVTI